MFSTPFLSFYRLFLILAQKKQMPFLYKKRPPNGDLNKRLDW